MLFKFSLWQVGLVNFIGAVVFSILGAIYSHGRDKKSRMEKITEGLIPIVLDDTEKGQEEGKIN